MSGKRGRGFRKRDWFRSRAKAIGPAAATGTYRAVLLAPENSEQWWRCSVHEPHGSYDEAVDCAEKARDRLAASCSG